MDIGIIETLNGGDAQIVGNDLLLVYNGENNLYLGMFGGNVEAVTEAREPGEEAFDHWANSLFYANEPSLQFNSTTEKAFQDIGLTSSGRVLIENAIKNDLKFMEVYGKITVQASITATDRLEILINWFTTEGVAAVTTLVYKKGDDGDFFLLDFNNDFLV